MGRGGYGGRGAAAAPWESKVYMSVSRQTAATHSSAMCVGSACGKRHWFSSMLFVFFTTGVVTSTFRICCDGCFPSETGFVQSMHLHLSVLL